MSFINKLLGGNTGPPPATSHHQLTLERSSARVKQATSAPKPVSERIRIIIGIDFGTTYSGAAYAIQYPGDDPNKTKVLIVGRWKGRLPGDVASRKVPSVIAYQPNGELKWGFEAMHEDPSKSLRWLKLLLEPELDLKQSEVIDIRKAAELLESYNKTPTQVASDYLKALWSHIVEQICDDYTPTVFEFAKKSIILTVPALWSPAAKNNTFLVAVGAGLAGNEYDLQIVSEPEAAAAAILNDRIKEVKAGDYYIVADAGGGTVDLSSYGIVDTKPLCFSERVIGDGDLCGAVFLDMAFKKLLRTSLRADTFDNLPSENVFRIMNDFESGIRKTFDGTERMTYTISLPGVLDRPQINMRAGIMTLSPAILLPVFDPIMERIERLVRAQIAKLKAKGHTPKAILLVGGFGENHFMKLRLKARFESQNGPTVLVPNLGGWESIASGAVQCELLGIQNLISVRIARYNLGVRCVENLDLQRNQKQGRSKYDGKDTAANQIRWCLKRGSEIKPNTLVRFEFTRNIPRSIFKSESSRVKTEVQIVRNDNDEAPTHLTPEAIKSFVSLTIEWKRRDIEKCPLKLQSNGRRAYFLRYAIVMAERDPATMEFWPELDGVKKGDVVEMRFNEPIIREEVGEGDEEQGWSGPNSDSVGGGDVREESEERGAETILKEKERSERERLERERLERERLERERLERERLERERLERERLERLEEERLEKERLEKERLEEERLKRERLERERLERERLERLEEERLENERLEKERLEKERLEKERLEKERLEKERLEKERLENERLENERLENERLENERLEKERLEKERLEKERLERLQKERLKKERLEKERLEKLEKEILEKERLDKERLENERLERERLKRENLERERLEKERLDKERLERERLERERLKREILERERLEKERLERESLKKERLEKEALQKGKEALENEPLEDEPLEDEPLEDEPSEDELLEDEPLGDELLEDELLEDASLEDEPLDDEPLKDERPGNKVAQTGKDGTPKKKGREGTERPKGPAKETKKVKRGGWWQGRRKT